MNFFTWLMQFAGESTPKGRLAFDLFSAASEKPDIMTIDSFRDLVGVTDPNDEAHYIDSLSMVGLEAISESLWLEFCEATDHPVNPPQESRHKTAPRREKR